jgi:hypothetical protein
MHRRLFAVGAVVSSLIAFPAAAGATPTTNVCGTSTGTGAGSTATGGCSQTSSQGNGTGGGQLVQQGNQSLLQISGLNSFARNRWVGIRVRLSFSR